MLRYPFTVPGFARLVESGGSRKVDRLRGGLEPLVMSVIQYLSPRLACQAVSSEELNTLDQAEYPREWWVRTAFVPAEADDAAAAREYAWLTIEYSQWEEEENWAVQAFIRVAEVEISLSADSDSGDTTITLHADRLPTRDSSRIGEIMVEHFGPA
jgi:hypothetical protein